MNTFFKDKPLFGLDIGSSSIKVMQIEREVRTTRVVGYGSAEIEINSIKDGVIVEHEVVAKTVQDMFKSQLVGDITTRRVALSVPASRTFTRAIKLPNLSSQELDEAVRLEAEQYIPVPLDSLYLDYSIMGSDKKDTELLAVAIPKTIVDSHMLLARLLGLEPITIEPTASATARLFNFTENNDLPSVLIDFGSTSVDVTIFDKEPVVTGTIGGGGEDFISRIADKLDVSRQEAKIIKTRYGINLSKKQADIREAVKPILDQLIKEIRRMSRYYEDRYDGQRKLSQIIIMGGGSSMPGLPDFMTNELRLPVRTYDPWQQFSFKHLSALSKDDRSSLIPAAGLALIKPREIFA